MSDYPSDIPAAYQAYPQLFQFWSNLSAEERNVLLDQLNHLDFSLIERQKQLLKEPLFSSQQHFFPFTNYSYNGNPLDWQEGQELLRQGQMGCLVLAGGQGSRLRFDGPKGMYPISIIKHKSLFQLFAEKTQAASRQVDYCLPLAIMTSPQYEAITKRFFHDHHLFGLDPAQLSFFTQKDWPLLDAQGQLFLEAPNRVAMGPNGNGWTFYDFVQSGIWERWHQQGVRYVNVVYIDNPLADPFDVELLGYHVRHGVDVTFKCTEKESANEKVGVLVKQDYHYRVIEYSEMAEENKNQYEADGKLTYRCAYIGLFCLSMDFIRTLFDRHQDFPLHRAWKAAKYVDDAGVTHRSQEPHAWKFETFIFDFLLYTNKVAALLYPRDICFAPLKNFSGADSPDTVQQAMQKFDRHIIHKITGIEAPDAPFELACDFYYPTSELLAKWKGKSIAPGYVYP